MNSLAIDLPLLNSIKFGAFSFYGTSQDKGVPNSVEFARKNMSRP